VPRQPLGAVLATVSSLHDNSIGGTKMTTTTGNSGAKRFVNRRHTVPDSYRDGSGRRVYDLLRMRIRLGEVAPNELFVENALIRSLSATRSAVRRALQGLADEGLLDRSPRSGTRLRGHIVNTPLLSEMRPPLADDAADGSDQRLVVSLVHRGVATPTEAVTSRLQLPAGTPVVAVEQILHLGSEPVGVRSAYFSLEPHPERVLKYFAVTDYHPLPRPEFFEQVYGVPAGRSEFTIEAVPSLRGDHDVLGVAPGAPLLMRTVRSLDVNGCPRWLSFTHMRGDRVALCG
jgi:GntR family transcriptional regulator